MNVSDLRVGRKVKDLAKSFYGRIKAYDEALAGGADALAAALARNLYADGPAEPAQVGRMADYLQRTIARSRTWDLAHIGRADIEFPPAA
jgi:cytochrome b pre-mRNA-processing protein 3